MGEDSEVPRDDRVLPGKETFGSTQFGLQKTGTEKHLCNRRRSLREM